jgi:hypothetical protein
MAGHHDVALHIGNRNAVVDGLLAGPFFRVEAGVDDEAAGAEELVVELARRRACRESRALSLSSFS